MASKDVIFTLFETARLVSFPSQGIRLAAWQQLVTEAPIPEFHPQFSFLVECKSWIELSDHMGSSPAIAGPSQSDLRHDC